jgi:hypothetical protein
VTVRVVDRSAHAVPVEAAATLVVEVADRRVWPCSARAGRRGRGRSRPAGLDPERVAGAALDGALRLGLAASPLEAVVTGPGRARLIAEVRRRVTVDLEPLGLTVLGLWLGEVGDPTGHLGHWARVRDAVVAAGARVEVAVAGRDAAVAEHALAAECWAAWRVAGLLREGARAEVGVASARADHAAALAAAAPAAVELASTGPAGAGVALAALGAGS